VAVHTDAFRRLVASTSRVSGMPLLRQAFVPQPIVNLTADELRAYVHGDDPTTGRPFMQEVIDGLTAPVDEHALRNAKFERSTPRLVEAADEHGLQELFLQSGWTDRLPIVVPTEERVEAMLAGTSHARDEVVGHMRPTAYREAWEFTVEKVAVNAVMAGARPEYLPVILALAASGVSARHSTTSSMANMAVVNGPIRDEIGMGYGIGAMGPYNHANATIGRAYSLLSQNLQGGSVPSETYMGSQGNGYAFTNLACAENEEASPWEPFHVEHGFERSESTVAIWSGLWTTSFMHGVREKYWRENVRNLLRGMDPLMAPAIVLDPIAAREFVQRGPFDTKADLIAWIHDNASLPAGEYWDNQMVQTLLYPKAALGVEPFASKLGVDDDVEVPMFRLEDIKVVVVGGETIGTWRMFGTQFQGVHSVDSWR
jgi:hypothetical protein